MSDFESELDQELHRVLDPVADQRDQRAENPVVCVPVQPLEVGLRSRLVGFTSRLVAGSFVPRRRAFY